MDSRWGRLLDFVCAEGDDNEKSPPPEIRFDDFQPQFALVASVLLQFGTHHPYHPAFTPWAARGGIYRCAHPRSTKRWKPEPYVLAHPKHIHARPCPITEDGYVVIERMAALPAAAVDGGRPCAESNSAWLAQYKEMKSRLNKESKSGPRKSSDGS